MLFKITSPILSLILMLPSHFTGVVKFNDLDMLPVLNPKVYDGAQVFEASGRPMLVIGRNCSGRGKRG